MERIPRQFFTSEFKEEAVKLAVEGGLSLAEVGRRLSISPQTLKNWIIKHQAGTLNAPGSRTVSELEAELSRLRKELAEARLEKEIIKKAMAYLARIHLSGGLYKICVDGISKSFCREYVGYSSRYQCILIT